MEVWLKRAVIGWHGPSVARECGANIRDACPSLAISISGVEILNLFEELVAHNSSTPQSLRVPRKSNRERGKVET